jgi:hypothetical protein
VPGADLLADLGGDIADVDEALVEQPGPVDAGADDLVSRVSMPPTLTAS